VDYYLLGRRNTVLGLFNVFENNIVRRRAQKWIKAQKRLFRFESDNLE
jgi:hypothetical protein